MSSTQLGMFLAFATPFFSCPFQPKSHNEKLIPFPASLRLSYFILPYKHLDPLIFFEFDTLSVLRLSNKHKVLAIVNSYVFMHTYVFMYVKNLPGYLF